MSTLQYQHCFFFCFFFFFFFFFCSAINLQNVHAGRKYSLVLYRKRETKILAAAIAISRVEGEEEKGNK